MRKAVAPICAEIHDETCGEDLKGQRQRGELIVENLMGDVFFYQAD